jgi:hypothetical protein
VPALPGRGSNELPVWQFDPDTRLVLHVVAGIVTAYRTADAEVSPLVIAAWANSPNRHLEGVSPALWAINRRDDGAVTSAARRAASGLAA